MKSEHIIIRTHPDVKKGCTIAAKASGMSLSEWLRMVIYERLAVTKNGKRKAS